MADVLSDAVFGRLTVVAETSRLKGRRAYLCRCACGTEIAVNAKSLKSGNTKSCGCLSGLSRTLNLEGKRYGRLVVIEREGSLVKCRCDCGHVVTVHYGALQQGKTKSCGCLRQEITGQLRRAPALAVGTYFGRLRVVEWKGAYTRCCCACGEEITVSTTHLRNGHTKSCGCLQKEKAGQSQLLEIQAGTKFGSLTVLDSVRVSGSGTLCRCRCACGNITQVRVGVLNYGHTQSCGCLRTRMYRATTGKLLPGSRSSGRGVYRQYAASAKANGRVFEFELAEFLALIHQPCVYCGRTPEHDNDFNGLDRTANAKGYTKENSVACCNLCNRAKFQRTEAEFLNWVAKLNSPGVYADSIVTLPASVISSLFLRYQRMAHKRKKFFALEAGDVARLVSQACVYCGAVALNVFSGYRCNGIDRISNDIGYTKENSITACKHCNRAKGQLSVAEFKGWAERVVSFRKL